MEINDLKPGSIINRSSLEKIEPNAETVKIIAEIVAQNRVILEMNMNTLKSLCSPIWMVSND